MPVRSPFEETVRDEVLLLAPLVREHFAPESAILRYEGVMTSIWRAGGIRGWFATPFLWLGSWTQTLFPETGTNIPFEIVNRLSVSPDGITRMSFERTFFFPRIRRRFEATMHYSEHSQVILDALGGKGFLLVELHPSVSTKEGAITIRSGRQWLVPFNRPFRARLPGFLAAQALIREWQQDERSLGISVTISNPLLGPFFGYEGTFRRVA